MQFLPVLAVTSTEAGRLLKGLEQRFQLGAPIETPGYPKGATGEMLKNGKTSG